MILDTLRTHLRAHPGERHPRRDDLPRAAVAAVFGPGDKLLFIRRSERKGDPWSGHMAFPGGRQEPTDRDELDTAIRETHEELGLDLRRPGVELLGRLAERASPSRLVKPRIVITPYVFYDPEPPELAPNEEVARVHWFAMSRLLADEGRGSMQLPFGGHRVRFPVIRLEGADIWGLTLAMLDGMMGRIRGG